MPPDLSASRPFSGGRASRKRMLAEAELLAARGEEDQIKRFRDSNANNAQIDGDWTNRAYVAARERVTFLTGDVHRLRLLEHIDDV